ncbi:hypothetical protein, partial [Liquorilactobacillus vini]|uniref:hypothetical protein n=1 Tax=Liquorilactobacillus vini TaxID=238015 RepID=UPI00054D57C1
IYILIDNINYSKQFVTKGEINVLTKLKLKNYKSFSDILGIFQRVRIKKIWLSIYGEKWS